MIYKAKTICPICGTVLQPIPDTPIAKTIIHESFIDPASAIGSEDEKLSVFRQVRDEIGDWRTQTFGNLSV
jgi:arsenate reductase